MNVEERKLDVTLPPEAFRLIRFLANTKRMSADELAGLLLVSTLGDFAKEVKAAGGDVEQVMERAWGRTG